MESGGHNLSYSLYDRYGRYMMLFTAFDWLGYFTAKIPEKGMRLRRETDRE